LQRNHGAAVGVIAPQGVYGIAEKPRMASIPQKLYFLPPRPSFVKNAQKMNENFGGVRVGKCVPLA